jgi:hypothetical protein
MPELYTVHRHISVCKHGHPQTATNVRLRHGARGSWFICLACRKQHVARRLARLRSETAARIKPTVEERFWAKVDKRGPDECWPWAAGRNAKGYGYFHIGGERARSVVERSAHRASWVLARGPIPDGLYVLHRCDNPPCVNPAHLFLGTHLDNIQDMKAKGRAARGERSAARLHPERRARGEKASGAKITEAQVRAIRREHAAGATARAIAPRYGLHETSVGQIVRRQSWAHVEDDAAP